MRTVAVYSLIVLIVNFAFSSYRWIPAGTFAVAFLPLAESVALVWLIALSATFRGTRRRVALALSAAVFSVLAVFSAAEALFQFIFARSFVPRADIPMVRGGLLLLFGEIGTLADVLTPLTIVLIVAVFWAAGMLIATAGAFLLGRYTRSLPRGTIAGAVVIPLLIAVTSPHLLSATMVRSLTDDGRMEFADVMEGARESGIADEAHQDRQDPAAARNRYAFPGLLDRDIYVFVIEAYGYAAFSRDDLFRQLRPDFDRFNRVLERHGYGLMSNYLLAPVAGGFSWLAEATFLSGQWINSQPRFEQLYGNEVPTLTGMLHEGGYYTFTVRPGTVHGSWPEGWDLYRFEDALVAYEGDFGYRGPGFSYVPITDQFAIWKAHKHLERVRGPGGPAYGRPVLAYYQLVSSHTPFNRIPPYIEDWTALGDGSIYYERSDEILTFDNTWGGGSELDEGFVASISYVLTVITDYIDRFVDHERSPIFIIFGDHQPQRPIREQNAHLSVPIHVASRDQEVLDRFSRLGYHSGIRGEQPPPHPQMSEFFAGFARLAQSHRMTGDDHIEDASQ